MLPNFGSLPAVLSMNFPAVAVLMHVGVQRHSPRLCEVRRVLDQIVAGNLESWTNTILPDSHKKVSV
jgi:hypothetical protein